MQFCVGKYTEGFNVKTDNGKILFGNDGRGTFTWTPTAKNAANSVSVSTAVVVVVVLSDSFFHSTNDTISTSCKTDWKSSRLWRFIMCTAALVPKRNEQCWKWNTVKKSMVHVEARGLGYHHYTSCQSSTWKLSSLLKNRDNIVPKQIIYNSLATVFISDSYILYKLRHVRI